MDQPNIHRVLDRTLAIIMGGGAGSRLFPLTKDRSKPAVPLGGKYRLVDIPISNCLNSGLSKIYLLTQFNSTSLHRHVSSAYRFDHFGDKFVNVLAAQQTPSGSEWYQGTADAVRQNMRYFLRSNYDYYLILSGDQLYQMDFSELMERHIRRGADLTIATLPVEREDAKGFGIMHTDAESKITRFVEKPEEDALLDELTMPASLLKENGIDEGAERFQASMGIYVFNRAAMEEALDNDFVDFGKHVIPKTIESKEVYSHLFQGYWEDIGTIRAFFDANLDLAKSNADYDFYAANNRIYTNPRLLPASKLNSATISEAIVSDGCIINDAMIERAIIGVRSLIEAGTTIQDTIIMGADFYESDREGCPSVPTKIGIGRNCRIRQAIIDKNARIGDDVVIDPEGKPTDFDGDNYYIRDGIVVVPKNGTIPSGTVI